MKSNVSYAGRSNKHMYIYCAQLDPIREQLCKLVNELETPGLSAMIIGETTQKVVQVKCPQEIVENIKNYLMIKMGIDWYYNVNATGFDLLGDAYYIKRPEIQSINKEK